MLKLTKTGIGLLTRQYRSVLRKCWEINVGLWNWVMNTATGAASAVGGAMNALWSSSKNSAREFSELIAALLKCNFLNDAMILKNIANIFAISAKMPAEPFASLYEGTLNTFNVLDDAHIERLWNNLANNFIAAIKLPAFGGTSKNSVTQFLDVIDELLSNRVWRKNLNNRNNKNFNRIFLTTTGLVTLFSLGIINPDEAASAVGVGVLCADGENIKYYANTDTCTSGTRLATLGAMNSSATAGDNSIALGAGTSASGNYSAALGWNASAIGGQSTALGYHAYAISSDSTALGSGAYVSGYGSIALGVGSVADENNTVSVGSSSFQRRIVNVANGVNDHDAVTVGQLNSAISNVNIDDALTNYYTKLDSEEVQNKVWVKDKFQNIIPSELQQIIQHIRQNVECADVISVANAASSKIERGYQEFTAHLAARWHESSKNRFRGRKFLQIATLSVCANDNNAADDTTIFLRAI